MLHVVGNLCRDVTLAVDRFPEPGETLVARNSLTDWGGKGLNQAVAAARAGAEVTLHAAIGAQDLASIQADLAHEPGLVLRLDGRSQPSDGSTILVRPDGENLIVSTTACAEGFDPAQSGAILVLAAGDTVLMQGNLSSEVTAACLSRARQHGARTALNPSPTWNEPFDWGLVDHLILNRGELSRITGVGDLAEGARRLRDAGTGSVVVTLGGDGALLFDRKGSLAVPAPSVAVRDTAGAGDVLCGGFMAYLGRGQSPAAALARAVAAAALSVTRPGALASCPTADEMARLPLPEPAGLNR